MIKALKFLVIIAIVVAVLAAVTNFGGRLGVAVGLLLGTLLGPARIAGVDFRQWFRDPGTPSEIGDDSFIGLVRQGFHVLVASWALAFVALVDTVSAWMPTSCVRIDPRPYLAMLPDRLYIPMAGAWLGDLLTACSGALAGLNLIGGTFVGAALMLAAVDIVWRLGLTVRLPPPSRPLEYLATQILPNVGPENKHKGRRRLIVCCDGTWNWPESRHETNVVRLVRALMPVDSAGITQIIHYHQGVGTGNFLDRAVGGGAGIGLTASVKACYGFLVDNYQEHDEIFLFGFSRGAYVARSLAGLIGTIGLLRKHEMDRFADVWHWYWQDEKNRDPAQLHALAPQRSSEVEIECIGVWDTVGALGIPGSRLCAKTFEFHETELGPRVRHAFQALAIDEQRGNFQGAVWVPYKPDRRRRGEAAVRRNNVAVVPNGQPQELKQMWFPGVHSNIGGGYLLHGLSDTSFLWMLFELRNLLGINANCVVDSLDRNASQKYPRGKLYDSRSLFWKLIWCPIPRPVCIISETERVHESAEKRSILRPPDVPTRDIYRREKRRKWLAAMRNPYGPHNPVIGTPAPRETAPAELARPAPDREIKIPRTLGFCGWIRNYINPQG
jgi:Uncharacterized alpha/beta hydrolase domain (DUF2235)